MYTYLPDFFGKNYVNTFWGMIFRCVPMQRVVSDHWSPRHRLSRSWSRTSARWLCRTRFCTPATQTHLNQNTHISQCGHSQFYHHHHCCCPPKSWPRPSSPLRRLSWWWQSASALSSWSELRRPALVQFCTAPRTPSHRSRYTCPHTPKHNCHHWDVTTIWKRCNTENLFTFCLVNRCACRVLKKLSY